MARRVIVIESPDSALLACPAPLRDELLVHGERLSWAGFVPERLTASRADVVVLVAVPEPGEAVHLFHRLAEHPVHATTFAVLPRGCADALLGAAARVVDDFVLWPADPEEVRQRLSRIGLSPDAEEGLAESMALGQMVGRAPAFLDIVGKLPRLAASEVPVLLTGETGTGKELCARALHFLGPRRSAPFIAVDCGALPDSLFESEFFGHTRGAFTDAHAERRGLVAVADGGTVFLDEVDVLSPGAQAKILRFLEERTYRPLGSDRSLRADVHVISATNQSLERHVEDGRFRRDLFFRLAGFQLHLPPLRERPGDVELLAHHFLVQFQRHDGAPPKVLSISALHVLRNHAWPGNVRELANVVRSAMALAPQRQILPEDLALPPAPPAASSAAYRHLRAGVVASFERHYLEDLLRRHHGNVTHASREAGQDRRALGRLIRKHAIDPHTFH